MQFVIITKRKTVPGGQCLSRMPSEVRRDLEGSGHIPKAHSRDITHT